MCTKNIPSFNSRTLLELNTKDLNRLMGSDRFKVVFHEIQTQPDSHSCGLFTVAFAVELAADLDPAIYNFDTSEMWSHLSEYNSAQEKEGKSCCSLFLQVVAIYL